jgi:hypothetical protein
MTQLEERAQEHGEDTELGEACSAAWRKMSQYYTDSDTKSYLATATILDPRYRFGVFDNLEWTVAEKENAFECFTQQFRLYQARYVEEIAASTEVEAQSQQHPRPADTGSQAAPKRRKLAHPDDDVGLLSTGLFYVEEEDAAPDAEIAAYQDERRLTADANPLDFWRCNSSRYPVLSRMVESTPLSSSLISSLTVSPVVGPGFLADPGDKCAGGGCVFFRFPDNHKAAKSAGWADRAAHHVSA